MIYSTRQQLQSPRVSQSNARVAVCAAAQARDLWVEGAFVILAVALLSWSAFWLS